MQTAEKNAKSVQGAPAKTNSNSPKTENRPSIPGNEKNNDPAKTEPAKGAEAEAGKSTENANGSPAAVDNKPADAKQPAAEVKTVLNLDATLKAVEELHRRSLQRINLISRIKQLEAFQVNLATENDELEDNPYQGCRLIIKDDKNREFITTTPGLIRLVTQFIFDACHEKLGEIEAHIVFPG